VYYVGGRPAARARVELQLLAPAGSPGGSERSESQGDVYTDAAGKFRWDDVAAGSYHVQVQLPTAPDLKVYLRRRLEVKAGEDASVEIGKKLGKTALKGRLTGLDGHASPFGLLLLKSSSEGDNDELLMSVSKSEGWRFSCPYLRPGKYAAEVELFVSSGREHLLLQPVEIEGDTEQDIEVPPAGG
jgi:hypothetical protein